MPKYQICDNIKQSEVYGSITLLDTQKGIYFEFNESAKLFWEEMMTAENDKQVIDNLTEKFNVNRNKIEESFYKFRDQLLSKGFIDNKA